MKLDIAHRKRREVKVTSNRSPKAKGFSLAAANLIVSMVVHRGKEEDSEDSGGRMNMNLC